MTPPTTQTITRNYCVILRSRVIREDGPTVCGFGLAEASIRLLY